MNLILTVCLVNFGWTAGQPYNQIANQAAASHVISKNEVQGKFQGLLHSIAKNDTKNSGLYHKILQQELGRERQAFDAMKEQLWMAQNRNLYKRKNFYEKSDVLENVVANKRETVANNHISPVRADSAENSAEKDVPYNAETFYKEVSDNLKLGLCEPFIKNVKQHFARSVKPASKNTTDQKIGASEDELQRETFQVFTNTMTKTQLPVEYIDKYDLLLRTDNFVHVFEIKFATDSDEKPNFRCAEKYLVEYLHRGKEIVCWGVCLLTGSDRSADVVGEWKAEIFTQEGTFKRSVSACKYTVGNRTFDD